MKRTSRSMSDFDLLSKSQVVREYGYPEHLLDRDLDSGAIPAFDANGDPVKGRNRMWISRYYIPRGGVDRRIAEMSGMDRSDTND